MPQLQTADQPMANVSQIPTSHAKYNIETLDAASLSIIPYRTRPRSAVGIESDCRSRGRKFYPSPVPYFRGV